MRGSTGAVLLALTAFGTHAACRTRPAADDPSTLTVAVRADVTGFFPNRAVSDAYSTQISANVLEGLVRFDRAMKVAPGLAARWENPDERTYVFDLRPGIVFSDGSPLTAADVVASLEAARDNPWGTSEYLQAVESVRAVSPSRVEIRTRMPYTILLEKLPWGFVLPARAIEARPRRTLGTGPFVVESWTPGQEFVLQRNERYRGPAPGFRRVRFVVTPDARERIARVERGEADLADQVPPAAIGELARRSDVRVIARPGLRVLYLALRVDQPPFRDPRVREALDLAIDRDELVRAALAGRAEPAPQLVPATVLGHVPALPRPHPDPRRARTLLAAAGYPRGLDVELDGPVNRYVNDQEILHELRRQLGEAGVRVTLNAQDKQAFFRRIASGGSKLHLIGWECDSGDGGDLFDAMLHSPANGTLGSENTTGLADADLDRLIDRANAARTLEERTAALQQAMTRALSLRALLPLHVQLEAVALSPRVAWDPPLNLALRLEDVHPAP